MATNLTKEQKAEAKYSKIVTTNNNPNKLMKVAESSKDISTIIAAIKKLGLMEGKKAQDTLIFLATKSPLPASCRCEAALEVNDKGKAKEVIKANIAMALKNGKYNSCYRYGAWMKVVQDEPSVFLDIIPQINDHDYYIIQALAKQAPDRITAILILTLSNYYLGISKIGEEIHLSSDEWLEIALNTDNSNTVKNAMLHMDLEQEDFLKDLAQKGNKVSRQILGKLNPEKYKDYIPDYISILSQSDKDDYIKSCNDESVLLLLADLGHEKAEHKLAILNPKKYIDYIPSMSQEEIDEVYSEDEAVLLKLTESGGTKAKHKLALIDPVKYEEYVECLSWNEAIFVLHKLTQNSIYCICRKNIYQEWDKFYKALEYLTDEKLLGNLLYVITDKYKRVKYAKRDPNSCLQVEDDWSSDFFLSYKKLLPNFIIVPIF